MINTSCGRNETSWGNIITSWQFLYVLFVWLMGTSRWSIKIICQLECRGHLTRYSVDVSGWEPFKIWVDTITWRCANWMTITWMRIHCPRPFSWWERHLGYCTVSFSSSIGGTKTSWTKFSSISDGDQGHLPKCGHNPPCWEVLGEKIFFFFDHFGWDRGQMSNFSHVHKAGERGRAIEIVQ